MLRFVSVGEGGNLRRVGSSCILFLHIIQIPGIHAVGLFLTSS